MKKKLFKTISILISSQLIFSCSPIQETNQTVKVENVIPTPPVKVEYVETFPKSASLNIGEKIQITATVNFTDGKSNTEINWVSSNNQIATVSESGEITALKQGHTIITAVSKTDAGKTSHISVLVNPEGTSEEEKQKAPIVINTININPVSVVITEGQSITLQAEVIKSDGSKNSNVIWKSLNQALAEIDQNGNLKAIRPGQTKVQAISKENETIETKSTIIIIPISSKPLPSLTPSPIPSPVTSLVPVTTPTSTPSLISNLPSTTPTPITTPIPTSSPQLVTIAPIPTSTPLPSVTYNESDLKNGDNFLWNETNTTFTFRLKNYPLLTEKSGNEARYKIEFTKPFRDSTEKEAVMGKYINFSPSVDGDFTVFSVENDIKDPSITNIEAINGDIRDKIIITFSEPLKSSGKTILQAALVHPTNPNYKPSRLWVGATNTSGVIPSDQTAQNNATLLGYSEDGTISGFKTIYVVGRIVNPTTNSSKSVIPLGGYNFNKLGGVKKAPDDAPIATSLNGNTITLEFASTAFDKDDLIILSAGSNISGQYNDKTKGISFNIQPGLVQELGQITDPSGRKLSSGNSSTLENITVNDSQKVSKAK